MKQIFTEEQKFSKSWVILIIAALVLLPLYGIYQQIILGQPYGDKPMSDFGLILFLLLTLALLGLFLVLKLKTQLTEHEIQMKYYPFFTKMVKWSDIKSAKVLNYGFVGGWGIRLWTKYGTVYNVKGSTGLAIEMKNGKKFLIGTQKETELKYALQQITRVNTPPN